MRPMQQCFNFLPLPQGHGSLHRKDVSAVIKPARARGNEEGRNVVSLLSERITGCSRPKAKHFVETSRVGEELTHFGESGVAA